MSCNPNSNFSFKSHYPFWEWGVSNFPPSSALNPAIPSIILVTLSKKRSSLYIINRLSLAIEMSVLKNQNSKHCFKPSPLSLQGCAMQCVSGTEASVSSCPQLQANPLHPNFLTLLLDPQDYRRWEGARYIFTQLVL